MKQTTPSLIHVYIPLRAFRNRWTSNPCFKNTNNVKNGYTQGARPTKMMMFRYTLRQ